ncbi:Uncharacterised protein [Mycobacteroides abscessus subsp. abscessus]|nr:Uncharacterised protein [Mycobacteroides abscessus subsp. abscessus]
MLGAVGFEPFLPREHTGSGGVFAVVLGKESFGVSDVLGVDPAFGSFLVGLVLKAPLDQVLIDNGVRAGVDVALLLAEVDCPQLRIAFDGLNRDVAVIIVIEAGVEPFCMHYVEVGLPLPEVERQDGETLVRVWFCALGVVGFGGFTYA